MRTSEMGLVPVDLRVRSQVYPQFYLIRNPRLKQDIVTKYIISPATVDALDKQERQMRQLDQGH